MMMHEIINYAKAQGYDSAEYLCEWQGYDVYEPFYDGDETKHLGVPLVILVHGETIRMSTEEEAYKQLDESLGIKGLS